MNAGELDPRAVRRSFDRAAAGYDAAAVLQRRVREELLARLALIGFAPARIVDVGAGTGHGAISLAERFPDSHVIALDISEAMLHEASRATPPARHIDRLCADAARLPLADASVDLLFCNLVLQWCNDIDRAFGEFHRVLAPRGLLSFTTFGPDTLGELRAAWSEVDRYTHVNRFIDMHNLGDALVHAGLAEPVLDVEHYTLTYADLRSLMRDLKAIGAHNVTRGRPRGLTGRQRLAALEAAYARFRRDDRLPASYEVVFAQAWRPESTGPGGDGGDGGDAVRIPLSRIGRRRQML